MAIFLRFCVLYLILSGIIVILGRDAPLAVFYDGWTSSVAKVPVFSQIAAGVLGVSLLGSMIFRPEAARQILISIALAFIATLLLHGSFTLIKTSMYHIMPFWADPLFAEFDKAIHFGKDPWVLAHAIKAYLPVKAMLPFYLEVWGVLVISLPVFLAAFDRDEERVRRTLIMFIVAMAFLGNVVAFGGMSAGPVYYDRMLGGSRFAELTGALENSLLAGSNVMAIQENLWRIYVAESQSFGAGISAFPSVHVSVAMVWGFYLYERSRWLAPVSILFVAVILYLAVFTGYHYAIDGYFSIIVMGLLWRWLKRRIRSHSVAGQTISDAFELT